MSKYISKHYFKILLLVFSVSTILALGYQPHSIRHLLGKTIFLWLVLYFTYKTNKKLFYISSSIIFIMSLLYMPQAIMLGPISTGILISLFETNTTESIEYLSNIPSDIYFYCLLYVALFILLIMASKQASKQATVTSLNIKIISS
ncbi:putative phosphoethanolamine transferase [Canicola haemoglobinophilus]|uniref:Putative phosphoethanolamine transferase n=1 Tax=Canicola haemoglobinophilus TaxID=733 RepID=A0A377HX04_9PAST|nr:hypothetical protein [Canicola haemoglobinophilus]STO60873.1 putative phosphoethanolamine transferase [Canicola haemoglobinophilus]